MMVLSPTGQLKATTCSLSKKLDTFRIVRAGKVRRIPMVDIQQIHAGVEPEVHPSRQPTPILQEKPFQPLSH